MRKHKILCAVAAFIFMLTMAFAGTVPQAEAAGPLPDIDGYWAESQVEYMLSKDIVGGYPDGNFKPANTITRAEFMEIVNNTFAFTGTAATNFSDVTSTDWFAPVVAKAAAAGYISGYPDGTMKPNAQISRQEAAVIIAKAAKLDLTAAKDLSQFSDAASIADWSKAAIAACAQTSYINGYPDGTFQAGNSITRAEAIVIASNTMPDATIYGKAGTYGSADEATTINGDVIVTAADVNLQNITITGNLLIAQNVGEGNVGLKNITVKGKTQINGGGANSVKVGSSNLGNVVNYKPGVRIVCSGGSTIVSVVLATGATVVVEAGSTIEGVTVSTTGEVTLNGDFASVTAAGAQANVTVTSGTIDNIVIGSDAVGTVINIASGATVTNLAANAPATVTGTGTITNATVNVNGVTIEQTPTTTTAATDVTTTVGGTTITGTSTPAGGGGGGGGGGTATPTVAVTSLSINSPKGILASADIIGNNGTVDLSGIIDATTQITSITIGATSGSSMVLKNVSSPNLGNVSMGRSLPTLSVDVNTLLAGVVPDNQIGLGTLREIFGSEVVITGMLSQTGYNSATVTLTVYLGTGENPIPTKWADLSVNETTKTITAIIKSDKLSTPLVGMDMFTFVNNTAGVIPTAVGVDGTTFYNPLVSTDLANLKSAISSKLTPKTWDTATLGNLVGKTLYVKTVDAAATYTIIFQ